MAVKHGVKDTDNHFIIDPVTRSIINKSGKLVLIQHDHNSERFTFECPRYVDEHDMSLCDSIEIHYINTGSGGQKSSGIYRAKDLKIPDDRSNTVTFSWLISRNATKHVGKLNFVVRFACYEGHITPDDADTTQSGIFLVDKSNEAIYNLYVDGGELTMDTFYGAGTEANSENSLDSSDEYYIENGRILEYAWNTGIYSDISVSKSIYNSEEFVEDYVDVLESWKHDLYTAGLRISSVEQTITSDEDGGTNVVTMKMSDESIETFQIKNGSRGNNGDRGVSITDIKRTSGTGAAGTTDTYTINMDDGTKHTFSVYNGADGKPTSIPSDWNQNDSSEPDYVKNRPFYTSDPIETAYIDNVSIDFSEGMVYNTLPFTLVEGREYRVIWNGVEYVRTCYIFNGVPGLGNGSLTGAPWQNTNEPFMFLLEGIDRYIFSSTNDTITVSLIGVEYEITKIDSKYLPAMVGKDVTGNEFRVLNETVVAEANSEIFNDYGKNVASGEYSHAEGTNTNATGTASHAQGGYTYATGDYSHAEGFNADANGDYAHAEGRGTEAIGDESHAEGYYAKAEGVASHAEGSYTIATGDNSHVQGRYNIEDTTKNLLHIVGNGSPSKRSNAHTVSKTGEAWFAGDVYVGSTSGVNKDEGSLMLATKKYVDEAIAAALASLK